MVERDTKQKKLILDIVKGTLKHPTAEDIFNIIRQKLPNISLTTVYRNLNKMAEKGEIKRLQIPNQPDRFEKNLKNHYHICCNKCGMFDDIHELGYFKDFKAFICENGFEIQEHDIIFKGICLKCKS